MSTNRIVCYKKIKGRNASVTPLCIHNGSSSRIRTCDSLINSQVLYRLSYRGIKLTTYTIIGILTNHVKMPMINS